VFKIIEKLVSELSTSLEGFTGGYVGNYETSLIDNSKQNLFYIKDRNSETADISFSSYKEPVRINYELSVICQFEKNINPDILFKKIIFALNQVCANRAKNFTVSYDSPKIAEDETGLKLKVELNLMKVNFTYSTFLKIQDCKECLTDTTC